MSYDFISRPAYQHALVSGNTDFLRLMLRTVHEYGIEPASLIHALQNHDELTLELVHFWTKHASDNYTLSGQTWPGAILREMVRSTMYERLTGEHAPYNLRFVTNGIACTTISIITATLGLKNLDAITDDDRLLIVKIHLLLVMFNAFQPGVFALSGWDLVGALPLPHDSVASLMQEGDTRWIHRGGYDLMGDCAEVSRPNDLPRARMLYGSLPEQLRDPDSFASKLKHLLAVRRMYGLASSRQMDIPEVSTPGLLVMLHELPDEKGTQITALNFGATKVGETITLTGLRDSPVIDMVQERIIGELDEAGQFDLEIEPFEGLSLRIAQTVSSLI